MKNICRETIKQEVGKFLKDNDHGEKELTVSVSLDNGKKKQICSFHINADYREILENNSKSGLIISDFTTPQSLIPELITIPYTDVISCETEKVSGSKKADTLTIVLEGGTIIELSFLYI